MRPGQDPAAVAQARGSTAVRKRPAIMDMIQEKSVFDRFQQIMGDNAKGFLANVLQTIQFSPELMQAEPKSVITAAMIAASLDLPIDKNLGFSAIVPYRDKERGQIAQFQLMTKGYVQLAQRTNQYASIHVTEIYDDELESFDFLTGIPTFKPVDNGWRSKAFSDSDKDNTEAEKHIVGYAATFVLLSGFKKTEYWPVKKIDAHGRKFSKTFNSAGSPWQTNRAAMRKKTVLKALFKWGPLSVNIQTAMRVDGASGMAMSLDALEYDDAPEAVASPAASEPEQPSEPAATETPTPAAKGPGPTAETEESKALSMGVPETVEEPASTPPAEEPATSAAPAAAPSNEGQPGLGIF